MRMQEVFCVSQRGVQLVMLGGHRDWGSEREGVTRVGNVSPKLKNQCESSSVHTPLALAFQQMLRARRDSLSIWGRG